MNARVSSFLSRRPEALQSANLRALAGPILICMILGMMILPLPPFLLDLLFTFNIALSVMVLLVSMYTMKPLDFAAFPSVLLFSTLLRLSLNVASTRIVLLEGHTGPDAAGKVIEAFGHFLVGGNFAVGIVVFVILMVINFMVITKGAGRIAEVSARFTLDAMPGKQMAIDADLNAGIINEEQARKRRTEVAQEAEFYGSMDGASKFVRGDAIAGLLIMVINIIGGLIVGVAQHDMSFAAAAKNYTLLTIGDGLVAQIPSLVISTAAGVIVSRVATNEDIGTQLTTQLFSNPRVLMITGSILVLMGLIPDMPHFAFLLLGGGAIQLGRVIKKRAEARSAAGALVDVAPAALAAPENTEASWDDVTMIDTLGLEVGYRLIPLVDRNSDGELLKRIKSIRKKFAQEFGFLPPVIHIRDNLELRPNGYRITLKGVEIGVGEAYPGQWLAINPGQCERRAAGHADHGSGVRAARDLDRHQSARAGAGVRLHRGRFEHGRRDAPEPIWFVTHASELLGRQEVQALLERTTKNTPSLVEELVPKQLSITTLQKTLQNLLERRRADPRHAHDSRSDRRTHAEALRRPRSHRHRAARARPRDHAAMVPRCGRHAGDGPRLESRTRAVAGVDDGRESGPRTRARANAAGRNPARNDTPAESRPRAGAARAALAARNARALLRRSLPQLKVLSYAEVPDTRNIKVVNLIGGQA